MECCARTVALIPAGGSTSRVYDGSGGDPNDGTVRQLAGAWRYQTIGGVVPFDEQSRSAID
jgi:hypothetical protein